MSKVEQDNIREERIDMEIVVDAYNEEEQAMGWYYYLEGKLNFPFKAIWISVKKRDAVAVKGEQVEVIGMAPEDDCSKEMFVEVIYREEGVEDIFSVPLYKIQAIDADEETEEAVSDWHYWVDRGYEL